MTLSFNFNEGKLLLEHWTNDSQFQVLWGELAEKSFLVGSQFRWKTLSLSFQSSCKVHVVVYFLCILKLDCIRAQGSMTDSCCIMFRIFQFYKVHKPSVMSDWTHHRHRPGFPRNLSIIEVIFWRKKLFLFCFLPKLILKRSTFNVIIYNIH